MAVIPMMNLDQVLPGTFLNPFSTSVRSQDEENGEILALYFKGSSSWLTRNEDTSCRDENVSGNHTQAQKYGTKSETTA